MNVGIRRSFGPVTLLLALACNELLGLDAGKLGDEAGGGGSTAAGGDRSSAGMRDGSGGADVGGGAGGAVSCSSTADCIDQGLQWPPYLCLAGNCVDVLTNECDTVLGAEWLAERPEEQPVVFGAVTEDIDESSASYWSLELAMREFTEHGLFPIDGAAQRPILLLCRLLAFNPDPLPTRRTLDHLIDHVGVPGMLMIESRQDLRASIQYALEQRRADVFFLDVGRADGLSTIIDGGRLWHMSSDAHYVAASFKPLVTRVEERVNPGASTRHGARLTRLVIVPPKQVDDFESVMPQLLETELKTNGQLAWEDPETYRLVPATTINASTAVALFEPDIVIDFAGLYGAIDEEVQNRGGVLPFYVLPPSQAGSPFLRERIAADPSLRTRVAGVNEAHTDDEHRPLYDGYLERFARIAPAGIDASANVNVYEAAYFLLYAAVAGGTGGVNMNAGMTRLLGLVTSSRRDIGPTTIDSVLDLLSSAPSLSLHGALGAPSFDPYTGSRVLPGTVWCIDENLDYAMDVLQLSSDEVGQRVLVGTFPCFDL